MASHNKMICENSLRWILNLRRNKLIHNYNIDLIKDVDGHTMNSMLWTIHQSRHIDRIGLYEWIHTENSNGYDKYLTNVLRIPI